MKADLHVHSYHSGYAGHLRVLRASGLVEIEEEQIDQDARLRVYRLRPEPFVALQAWLDQVQAFWTEQLGAFKDHIERTQKGKQT